MSIVILNSLEHKSEIPELIMKGVVNSGQEVVYFPLKDLNVSPCRSCGACSFKSPGRCIINDDIHEILTAIAKSSAVIMLTHLRFGGYSSCLKKVVDKFMLLCLPSYIVRKGRLLHPNRYGSKLLVGIGVTDNYGEDEVHSFNRLVEHNALNIQSAHKTLIINTKETHENTNNAIDCLLCEVCI